MLDKEGRRNFQKVEQEIQKSIEKAKDPELYKAASMTQLVNAVQNLGGTVGRPS